MHARVIRARARQASRWQSLGLLTNQQLTSHQIRQHIALTTSAQAILEQAVTRWQLSARSYFKLIKVARTIADLDDAEITTLTDRHVGEALTYRQSISLN